MKISIFKPTKINEILSWVKLDIDRQYWSGNTFNERLNFQSFNRHIKRKNLFPYCCLNQQGILISYGEIVVKNSKEVTLCRVIVKPDLRRKGIGKIFVKELTDLIFRSQKIHKISLNTLGNNIPARKCYLSLGFKEVRVKKNMRLVSNQWVDLIIMEKINPILLKRSI